MSALHIMSKIRSTGVALFVKCEEISSKICVHAAFFWPTNCPKALYLLSDKTKKSKKSLHLRSSNEKMFDVSAPK